MPASSFQQQKLRVCEVCSAYLGLHDNDRRLADHFGGKLHIGFIEIREKLEKLQVRWRLTAQSGWCHAALHRRSALWFAEGCDGETGAHAHKEKRGARQRRGANQRVGDGEREGTRAGAREGTRERAGESQREGTQEVRLCALLSLHSPRSVQIIIRPWYYSWKSISIFMHAALQRTIVSLFSSVQCWFSLVQIHFIFSVDSISSDLIQFRFNNSLDVAKFINYEINSIKLWSGSTEDNSVIVELS